MNGSVGLNGLTKSPTPFTEYGIDLAETNFKSGYFADIFAIEMCIWKKIGIHVNVGGVNQFSFNENRFQTNLATRHPNHQTIFNYVITDGLFSWSGRLSYKLKFQEIFFTPFLSAGTQTNMNIRYSYALRLPATNYFTTYSVHNRNGAFHYGLGFETYHSKFPWLGLTLSARRFYNSSDYLVTSKNHLGQTTANTISTSFHQIIWRIGICYRIPIGSKNH